MLTIKFNICSDNEKLIMSKQLNYSYAFRKLYKNYHNLNDLSFNNYLKSEFNLSTYELNCLKIEVKTKVNQVNTQKSKLEKDIIDIENSLDLLKSKNIKSKHDTRKIFKLNKKLIYKNKSLSKDITFGGLVNLKQLSSLNNDKILNSSKIKEVKEKYSNARLLPISLIGSKNDKNSNRYFNFDFINNTITYKPNSKNKVILNYKVSKGYQKQLIALNEIKDLKLIPISVKLSTDYICITFDEEILNGGGFDRNYYLRESCGRYDKDTWIKYKNLQKENKLKDKLKNRYCSIDLNPEHIGVSIQDNINGKIKLVDKFCYNLTDLIGKSGLSSDSKESKYINNKRKYEIGYIYMDLFKRLKHYNVGNFVMEDLNFSSNSEMSREANRKTKNVWNLNYQQNLIEKWCNKQGLVKIEVNPCYTSFVGNIMNEYFDPVNASIEIGRRGIFKYNKGNFYPEMTMTILDTVIKRFSLSDAQDIKGCSNWVSLFKQLKETGVKYRWSLDQIPSNFSKNNRKLKWNLITF